jgi:cytochrome c oxidase subunit 4
MRHPPPLRLVLSWLALLFLLSLTVLFAYQPLGALNLPVALLIASVKALIVGVVFMELNESSGLKRAFAAAGFFWLGLLLWLAASDFLTRPEFPPGMYRSHRSGQHTRHWISVPTKVVFVIAPDQ